MPPNMIEIMDTEITDNFDLYIIGKSKVVSPHDHLPASSNQQENTV